jgi:hypothetical protein
MGVSGQRHAPAALYPRGKDPRYPLDGRLGGPQSRSGHRGYRKNPFASAGDQTWIARSSSPYIARHCIDWTTPAPFSPYITSNCCSCLWIRKDRDVAFARRDWGNERRTYVRIAGLPIGDVPEMKQETVYNLSAVLRWTPKSALGPCIVCCRLFRTKVCTTGRADRQHRRMCDLLNAVLRSVSCINATCPLHLWRPKRQPVSEASLGRHL